MRDIKLASPLIGFRETFQVLRAMTAKEISGYSSQFVPMFEREFANFVGVKYALSVNSGTSALTLAIRGLRLQPGDKVAVSALTNMATYFPILQVGAIPVPVDINPRTLNMDPEDLLNIMNQGIKAVVVVHLYGLPADMQRILEISKSYGVPVIEDCAESLGAKQGNIQTGGFGDIGCFSFYANKIITTGEGGMVTTNDPIIYDYLKNLRSLGFGNEDKFVHESDGYNFRLSNIQAAVGVGQLSKIGKIIRMKRSVAKRYNEFFEGNHLIELPSEPNNYFSVYWMYAIKIKKTSGFTAKQLRDALRIRGIESREGFTCYSDQVNLHKQFGLKVRETPVARQIQSQVLYLPSGPKITNAELSRVTEEVNLFLRSGTSNKS